MWRIYEYQRFKSSTTLILREYSSHFQNVDQMIEVCSKENGQLVELFENATNKNNEEYVKETGIAFSYEQLDPKYRYQIKLSKAMSEDEALLHEKKRQALEFMKDFIKNQPQNSTKNEIADALVKFINSGVNNSFAHANNLLEKTSKTKSDIIWDMDEETYNVILTKAGAIEILKTVEQIKSKEFVSEFVGQTIQKMMESTISGSNALMKELTSANVVSQVPHQSIYLKNLIGQFVGISQGIIFDRHTATLYDKLLEKDRDEVLKIFFNHVTQETMVKEIIRVVNEASPETKEAIKSFLFEDEYFDQETQNLTKKGALELLLTLGYLKS